MPFSNISVEVRSKILLTKHFFLLEGQVFYQNSPIDFEPFSGCLLIVAECYQDPSLPRQSLYSMP